jgi:hypothetical protein
MSRRLRQFVIGASVVAFALAMVPSEALAQRGRAPAPAGSRQAVARPPAHRPSYPSHRPYYPYYRPYYGYGYGYYRPYYPYYYSPFYWGVGFGYGYGYPYGYGWGAPYWYQYPYPPYYGGYYNYDEASARLEVTPKDAQVFVDGYYVGSVDDFDGVFQRLHVRSGEHTLEIYKEGYRTIRERMDFRRGETYKVKFTMEPLGAGEPAAARPVPAPDPNPPARDERPDRMRAAPVPPRVAVRGDGGALALRVQPEDATVLVDGERWDAPAGREPLVIQLEEGTHQIEVQKEGYRPYTAEIRVRRGETVPLNINLRRDGN